MPYTKYAQKYTHIILNMRRVTLRYGIRILHLSIRGILRLGASTYENLKDWKLYIWDLRCLMQTYTSNGAGYVMSTVIFQTSFQFVEHGI